MLLVRLQCRVFSTHARTIYKIIMMLHVSGVDPEFSERASESSQSEYLKKLKVVWDALPEGIFS